MYRNRAIKARHSPSSAPDKLMQPTVTPHAGQLLLASGRLCGVTAAGRRRWTYEKR